MVWVRNSHWIPGAKKNRHSAEQRGDFLSEVASRETTLGDQPTEKVHEGHTAAHTLLSGMRGVTRALDRVYLGMGYLCGTMFLLLALFIT